MKLSFRWPFWENQQTYMEAVSAAQASVSDVRVSFPSGRIQPDIFHFPFHLTSS